MTKKRTTIYADIVLLAPIAHELGFEHPQTTSQSRGDGSVSALIEAIAKLAETDPHTLIAALRAAGVEN